TETPTADVGTGILGKWKYIPNLDAFMALQDAIAGNIWLYTPPGGQAPRRPDMVVTPIPVQFGRVPVNHWSTLTTVRITNAKAVSLALGTVTTGGSHPDQFRIAPANDHCSLTTLAPGAS